MEHATRQLLAHIAGLRFWEPRDPAAQDYYHATVGDSAECLCGRAWYARGYTEMRTTWTCEQLLCPLCYQRERAWRRGLQLASRKRGPGQWRREATI